MDVSELPNRIFVEFANLPRGARVSIFALLGVTLTFMAIPRFEDEPLTAFFYMAIAIAFFWMALAPFM